MHLQNGSSATTASIPPAPAFDNQQAEQEGWAVFEATSTSPFQIQSFDNADDRKIATGAVVPTTDDEAWALVVMQALAGSAYHLSALKFLKEHSPLEFSDISRKHPPLRSLNL